MTGRHPSSAAPAAASAADAIDALLPQTQCTRCGYQGCKPYAYAIASGAAEINQCPPGGAATIQALARLTARAPLPLNPANGVEGPDLVALIDEDRCIGCAKCLPPCPVDAIVGMRKQMHTVVAELCTGCELCIAPCPVDCIVMTPRASLVVQYAAPAPAANRERFDAHNSRIAHRAQANAELLAARKQAARNEAR
ncbi:MAG: RnfABCDGE type electron transport complex subunit B [Gammaproteobacteria bacterium]